MRKMFSENQVGLIAKNVIESGEAENAKPAYFHQILIDDRPQAAICMLLILNNDSTAYDDATKLTAELNRIRTAIGEKCRLVATGGFGSAGVTYPVFDIEIPDVDEFELYGYDGVTLKNITLNLAGASVIFDAVSKIN